MDVFKIICGMLVILQNIVKLCDLSDPISLSITDFVDSVKKMGLNVTDLTLYVKYKEFISLN